MDTPLESSNEFTKNRESGMMHNSNIRNLADDENWSALIRYWMVYQHEPALREAQRIVSKYVSDGNEAFTDLAHLLETVIETPYVPSLEVPSTIANKWQPPERQTLLLLAIYPRALVYQLIESAPVTLRRQLLQLGLLSADQGIELSLEIEHRELAALFAELKGYALVASGNPDEAITQFGAALTLLETKESQCSDLRAFAIARNLSNLGTASQKAGKREESLRSQSQAVAMLRELADKYPELCNLHLANALMNLGVVQRGGMRCEEAEQSLHDAVSIWESLINENANQFHPDFVLSLINLGAVQRHRRRYSAARTSYEKALRLLSSLDSERLARWKWHLGAVLNNLGNVLADMENYASAAQHLREALAIRRELAQQGTLESGADVSETLNNLGRVEYQCGNLEAARSHYSDALKIRRSIADASPTRFSAYVAVTLADLAKVQRDTEEHQEASESLAEAISIRRPMIEWDPIGHQSDVASLFMGLGEIQLDLGRDEEALSSYQEACSLYGALVEQDPATYQHALAAALNNFGSLLVKTGKHAAARPICLDAVEHYRQIVQRGEGMIADLAGALINLGRAEYSLEHCAHACERLEEAIDLLRRNEANVAKYPELHIAQLLNELGAMYQSMDDLAGAKRSHEHAVRRLRSHSDSFSDNDKALLVAALNNLSNVHLRLHNLEEAEELSGEAFAICEDLFRRRPEAYRESLAAVTMTFGTILRNLNQLDQALMRHRQAYRLYLDLAGEQPNRSPYDLCIALRSLGRSEWEAGFLKEAEITYRKATSISRELLHTDVSRHHFLFVDLLTDLGSLLQEQDKWGEARDCYSEALTSLTSWPSSHSTAADLRKAALQVNLASLLMNLGDKSEALKNYGQAVETSRIAARSHHPDANALLAKTLRGLAHAHYELGDFDKAKKVLDEVEELPREVRCGRDTDDLDLEIARFAILGFLHANRSSRPNLADLQESCDCFRSSLDLIWKRRKGSIIPSVRHHLQQKWAGVYDGMISTCFQLWSQTQQQAPLWEALYYAEIARATFLSDLLADVSLEPSGVPDDVMKEFRRIRQELRDVESSLNDPRARLQQAGFFTLSPIKGGPVESKAIPKVWRFENAPFGPQSYYVTDSLEESAAELRGRYESLLDQIQIHDPDFDPDQAIQSLAAESVRSIFSTDKPTAIVHYTIMRDGGVALIITNDGIEAIALPKLSAKTSSRLWMRWATSYHIARENGDMSRWETLLPSFLSRIADLAVQPVVNRVGDSVQRLLFVPNHVLHCWPLHCCTLSDRRCLLDRYEILYAPSLSVLSRCVPRETDRISDAVMVANPTQDLPFASVEAAWVGRQYANSTIVEGSQATKNGLLHETSGAHVWHYAGHAEFDLADPLRSALKLQDESDSSKWLTLRDIFSGFRLPACRLAVLSGCETALTRPGLMDEYVGLTSGLLYAGSSCVVSSLWQVPDLSTALLMDRFHSEWGTGNTVAGALREAQRWLRDDIVSGCHLRDEIVTEDHLQRLSSDEERRTCREYLDELALECPNTPPFSSAFYWGAFVAVGNDFET